MIIKQDHQSMMILIMTRLFCPPSLKAGAFTAATIDDIDHNPVPTMKQVHFMEHLHRFFSILL